MPIVLCYIHLFRISENIKDRDSHKEFSNNVLSGVIHSFSFYNTCERVYSHKTKISYRFQLYYSLWYENAELLQNFLDLIVFLRCRRRKRCIFYFMQYSNGVLNWKATKNTILSLEYVTADEWKQKFAMNWGKCGGWVVSLKSGNIFRSL